MLILTRKSGESIFVGDIEVKILGNRRGKIAVGIAAPRDVPIVRKELTERKKT